MKPIINTIFGCKYRKGKDITPYMTEADHYQWIFATKGTSRVNSEQELKEEINKYLLNPKRKSKEREILRTKLCYKVDGKSSERMVNAIADILENQ